jgi:hypothetical protein
MASNETKTARIVDISDIHACYGSIISADDIQWNHYLNTIFMSYVFKDCCDDVL